MVWGICHRGHRCNLRPPTYRYLERPKKILPSLEPVNEEQGPKLRRDPNSYAAVLAKNKSSKPENFFVDLHNDLMTKNSLEEEWPALSPEQELTNIAPKTWRPKRDSNVPEVWESTTQKESWISDEKSKVTADQIENDKVFAENLQASEYAQLIGRDENDEDNYNLAKQETYEENDENNYNPAEQKGETYEKKEISIDGHQESELIRIEKRRAPQKISPTCDICMDRPKDATLVCGHRYCYQCALQMQLVEDASCL